LTRLRAALRGAGQRRSHRTPGINQKSTRRERMKKTNRLTLDLPPEFIELCKRDGVEPRIVLRGFIADLAEIMNWVDSPRRDGYSSNGSDERSYAMAYYERVGYPWWHKG
jgi:hypothetical protein